MRKYLHIEIARQQFQVARSPGAEPKVSADENGLRAEPEQIGEKPARLLRRIRRAERNDHRVIDAQHRETPEFLVDRRENGGSGEVRFRWRSKVTATLGAPSESAFAIAAQIKA